MVGEGNFVLDSEGGVKKGEVELDEGVLFL